MINSSFMSSLRADGSSGVLKLCKSSVCSEHVFERKSSFLRTTLKVVCGVSFHISLSALSKQLAEISLWSEWVYENKAVGVFVGFFSD